MVRALPVLLLLLSAACGLAEDERDEKNRYIYLTFYDKAFEAYCLGEFDVDGDGRISRYEAQRVRTVECPERGVASLSDLKEFTRLERLGLPGQRAHALDVTMTRLEWLDCSDNGLVSLDVNGLRGLAYLVAAATRCRASICSRTPRSQRFFVRTSPRGVAGRDLLRLGAACRRARQPLPCHGLLPRLAKRRLQRTDGTRPQVISGMKRPGGPLRGFRFRAERPRFRVRYFPIYGQKTVRKGRVFLHNLLKSPSRGLGVFG